MESLPPLCRVDSSNSSSEIVDVERDPLPECRQNEEATNELSHMPSQVLFESPHSRRKKKLRFEVLGTSKEISNAPQHLVDPKHRTDPKEAYYFLEQKTFPVLLQIHRTWKSFYHRVKQDTKKMPFISNLVHVVRSELSNGGALKELFAERHGDWGFDSFHKNWETTQNLEPNSLWDLIFSAPIQPLISKKSQTPHKVAVSKIAPRFSTSEFARLFAIISKEDASREAFQNSVLELTREQLDRGYNRDAFWSENIAILFNDPSFCPVYSFLVIIEGIDITDPPPTNRDGPYLKRQYQAARKCFSVAYHNWSKSGQNDPDMFSKFTVLPRDETMTPDGENALVIFHVLRCGTKFLDRSLMDCIYRAIRGYNSTGFENDAGVGSVEPRRKRRRSNSASQNENDVESMKEIVNYATTQWSKSVAGHGDLDHGKTVQLDDDVDKTIFHVKKTPRADKSALRCGGTEQDRTRGHAGKVENDICAGSSEVQRLSRVANELLTFFQALHQLLLQSNSQAAPMLVVRISRLRPGYFKHIMSHGPYVSLAPT